MPPGGPGNSAAAPPEYTSVPVGVARIPLLRRQLQLLPVIRERAGGRYRTRAGGRYKFNSKASCGCVDIVCTALGYASDKVFDAKYPACPAPWSRSGNDVLAASIFP